MAVGYNKVDVDAANKYGVAVRKSPGVLTETTAELAASLSLAAARRIVEVDEFMKGGLYDGWLPRPSSLCRELTKRQTLEQVEGFKMNLIYFDLYQSTRLEKFVTAYGDFLKANGEATAYHLVNKERMAKMKKASCNGAGESGYELRPWWNACIFRLCFSRSIKVVGPGS